MRYLLDTNAYYCIRQSPGKLGRGAHKVLTAGGHEFLISVMTPWELSIKSALGKLLVTNLLVNFEERETVAGFTMTPITTGQAVSSGFLPRHHRDPFDRLLIAQAFDLQTPIITSDKTFDLYGVQRIWD
jgi:PIN domain nuclease of toxin-antitoxin system